MGASDLRRGVWRCAGRHRSRQLGISPLGHLFRTTANFCNQTQAVSETMTIWQIRLPSFADFAGAMSLEISLATDVSSDPLIEARVEIFAKHARTVTTPGSGAVCITRAQLRQSRLHAAAPQPALGRRRRHASTDNLRVACQRSPVGTGSAAGCGRLRGFGERREARMRRRSSETACGGGALLPRRRLRPVSAATERRGRSAPGRTSQSQSGRSPPARGWPSRAACRVGRTERRPRSR